MHTRRALAAVDAAVTVAELERVVIAAEAAQGLNVPDARRSLTDTELKAGVHFGDMNDLHQAAGEQLAAVTNQVQVLLSRWLLDELRDATPQEAVALLIDMSSPATVLPVPGLLAAMRNAVDEGVHVLHDLWRQSADETRREAARQGFNVPNRLAEPDEETMQVMRTAAAAVVTQAVTRIITTALEAARRA